MTLRAVFMGSPEVAVPSLRALANVCDLVQVVTQPDRPAGRGRRLTPPPVKVAAQALGVPVVQPVRVKDGVLARSLAALAPDIIVVVAYGRILPQAILDVPALACVNVHFSLLPRWRGAAPVQRAIEAGDRRTGVCLMAMEAGLDTGPVYARVETEIGSDETAGALGARLAELGAQALADMLAAAPPLPAPQPQDEAGATYARKLTKADGRVDWARPVRRVVDHARAMTPWPGPFTTRDGQRLKLFDVRAAVGTPAAGVAPGTVLAVTDDGLRVACDGGIVTVGRVQPAGRKAMAAQAYAAGQGGLVGARLGT